MLVTKVIDCMVLFHCASQTHCMLHIFKSPEIICGIRNKSHV